MRNIREVVCKNFKRLLSEKDFTQRSLAQITGFSTNTINRWATGIMCPETANIEALSEAFGVDPIEFFRVEDAKISVQEAFSVISSELGFNPPTPIKNHTPGTISGKLALLSEAELSRISRIIDDYLVRKSRVKEKGA